MDPLLLDPSLPAWPLPDAPLPRAGRFDDRLAPPLDFVDALPVVSELPRADDPVAVRVLALTVAPAEVRDDDRTAARSLDAPVASTPRRPRRGAGRRPDALSPTGPAGRNHAAPPLFDDAHVAGWRADEPPLFLLDDARAGLLVSDTDRGPGP